MDDPTPDATASNVLSQIEVEQLVAQVQAEEAAATVVKPGGLKARLETEAVQPFNFRQPAFLTPGELRKLRLRHEEFIRSLAARLSIYLRLELSMQMVKLQTVSFQKYTETLPSPAHITLFKVEPLSGVCLLDMPPRLALTMVDRLLGGPAQSVAAGGDLSEIETALVDQVAQIILNEWCQLWRKAENAHPVLLGHENNGQFLNSSPHDTAMLVLSIETRLGDCAEQLQLAFPYLCIEPLVRQPESAGAEAAAHTAKAARVDWNPGLDEVTIQLHTQWQGLELTARELAGLKPGDVLMLEPACTERVEVRFEQLPRFVGRLGTSGEHWAVQLTETVKS